MHKIFAVLFISMLLLISCASPVSPPAATPMSSPILTAAPTSTELPEPTPTSPAGGEQGEGGFVEGEPLPDSPLITPAHEPVRVSGTVHGAQLNFEVVLEKHVTENLRVQLNSIALNPDKDPQKILEAQAIAMFDTYRRWGGTKWGSVTSYMKAIAEFQAGERPAEDVSFQAPADGNFEDGTYDLEMQTYVPTADFVFRVVLLDERYVSKEMITNVGAGNKNQDALGIGVHKNQSGGMETWIDFRPDQDAYLHGESVSAAIAEGLIAPSKNIPGWDMSKFPKDRDELYNSKRTQVGLLLVNLQDFTSAFITDPMSPNDPNGR